MDAFYDDADEYIRKPANPPHAFEILHRYGVNISEISNDIVANYMNLAYSPEDISFIQSRELLIMCVAAALKKRGVF